MNVAGPAGQIHPKGGRAPERGKAQAGRGRAEEAESGNADRRREMEDPRIAADEEVGEREKRGDIGERTREAQARSAGRVHITREMFAG